MQDNNFIKFLVIIIIIIMLGIYIRYVKTMNNNEIPDKEEKETNVQIDEGTLGIEEYKDILLELRGDNYTSDEYFEKSNGNEILIMYNDLVKGYISPKNNKEGKVIKESYIEEKAINAMRKMKVDNITKKDFSRDKSFKDVENNQSEDFRLEYYGTKNIEGEEYEVRLISLNICDLEGNVTDLNAGILFTITKINN